MPLTKKVIATNADGTQSSEDKFAIEDENDLRDADYLLKLHGYIPTSKWELVNSRSSFWDTQVKGGKIQKLYSSKITVKPRSESAFDFDAIKQWYDTFDSKVVELKNHNINQSAQNCLVIPIADLHFNLLSSTFITGNEYNKKIALDNFHTILADVIERSRNKNITKIVYVLGNDMFNANGISGQTFRGTPQTEEGHCFEAYTELFQVVADSIKTLYEELNASVDVIYVTSNHDKENSFYFMYNLYTYYRNDKNVTIDYSPLPRKYYKFGRTLFMFSHDMKISEVADTFLDEAGDLIADIDYFECMLAHLHCETVKQNKNLTIRRLSTTSAKSAWANDEGYGSKRVHQSFVYNHDSGISDCLYVNV